MDLDEYLWRKKIQKKDFGKKLGVSSTTMMNLSHRYRNPELLTAINIVTLTNGEVTYKELLKDEDKDKLVQC